MTEYEAMWSGVRESNEQLSARISELQHRREWQAGPGAQAERVNILLLVCYFPLSA